MRDSMIGGTRWLVQALKLLNLLVGIGFGITLLVSFWEHGPLVTQLVLKYGAAHAGPILTGMRVMLAAGILAVGVAYVFLRLLAAILATVAAGDPFIAENGVRLRRMGFALLVYQLGDLALGVIDHWLDLLGADTVPWFPSLGGWLVVVLLFVLARVFAVGAAMRDDLEGTV